jgi:hypothetical protein
VNKFFSFEMVFDNGERFSGNMVASYSDITCEMDVTNVETMIKQKLNATATSLEETVMVVTLTNWKAL